MPKPALREAVVNAVVHRDYAVPAPIQIRVYADRLSIWNAGELPENWSHATLLGPHSSQPYNPDIANAFFRAGEIEAWGRGIQRVMEACRDAETPEPVIRVEARGFWFEFPFSADYVDSLEPPRVLQRLCYVSPAAAAELDRCPCGCCSTSSCPSAFRLYSPTRSPTPGRSALLDAGTTPTTFDFLPNMKTPPSLR